MIELLVVIAIIGILVLLAMPKFNDYMDKAYLTQIQTDIKVAEGLTEEMLINNDYKFPDDWESVEIEELTKLAQEDKIYDAKGLIRNEIEDGKYLEIPKHTINTKLKGNFYANHGGKVYYEDPKNASEPSKPETNKDYEWINDENGYEAINKENKGYYSYVGKSTNVEIPKIINGHPMTSYFKMFHNNTSSELKVKSTNSNIIDMSFMFSNSQAINLNVDSLNTSKVVDMKAMFSNSQADVLDLRNFDTSNVLNFGSMFYYSQVTTLNLDSFNTSNVTNMNQMFLGSEVIKLDLTNFDTSNVIHLNGMFKNTQIISIDLSNFNTTKAVYMNEMFKLSKINSLDLSSFDTSNLTDMSYMFENAVTSTGYANTQSDADKFNASEGKPSTLTFTVK